MRFFVKHKLLLVFSLAAASWSILGDAAFSLSLSSNDSAIPRIERRLNRLELTGDTAPGLDKELLLKDAVGADAHIADRADVYLSGWKTAGTVAPGSRESSPGKLAWIPEKEDGRPGHETALDKPTRNALTKEGPDRELEGAYGRVLLALGRVSQHLDAIDDTTVSPSIETLRKKIESVWDETKSVLFVRHGNLGAKDSQFRSFIIEIQALQREREVLRARIDDVETSAAFDQFSDAFDLWIRAIRKAMAMRPDNGSPHIGHWPGREPGKIAFGPKELTELHVPSGKDSVETMPDDEPFGMSIILVTLAIVAGAIVCRVGFYAGAVGVGGTVHDVVSWFARWW